MRMRTLRALKKSLLILSVLALVFGVLTLLLWLAREHADIERDAATVEWVQCLDRESNRLPSCRAIMERLKPGEIVIDYDFCTDAAKACEARDQHRKAADASVNQWWTAMALARLASGMCALGAFAILLIIGSLSLRQRVAGAASENQNL